MEGNETPVLTWEGTKLIDGKLNMIQRDFVLRAH